MSSVLCTYPGIRNHELHRYRFGVRVWAVRLTGNRHESTRTIVGLREKGEKSDTTQPGDYLVPIARYTSRQAAINNGIVRPTSRSGSLLETHTSGKTTRHESVSFRGSSSRIIFTLIAGYLGHHQPKKPMYRTPRMRDVFSPYVMRYLNTILHNNQSTATSPPPAPV